MLAVGVFSHPLEKYNGNGRMLFWLCFCDFAPPPKDILTEHLEGTVWQTGNC